MIIIPEIKNIVKVIKVSKAWDSQLLGKIGLVRQVHPLYQGYTVIGVEFVDWEKGHKLAFDCLDRPAGWFFFPWHLEVQRFEHK